MNHFDKIDIRVFDRFIEKFADRYIKQRSELFDGISEDVLEQAESTECGFDLNSLLKVIRQNSVAPDIKRDNGEKPLVFKDIYRSDLGELLTTYYFEERISEDRRFLIPIKNISYRERFDLPGRGFDAIGYRTEPDKVNILMEKQRYLLKKKIRLMLSIKTMTQYTYLKKVIMTILGWFYSGSRIIYADYLQIIIIFWLLLVL